MRKKSDSMLAAMGRINMTRDEEDDCLTPPIGDIDTQASLEKVFSPTIRSGAYISDPSHMSEAAVSYAIDCMAPAIGTLALRVQESGNRFHSAGWTISQQQNARSNDFSMILSHEEKPGAWHLGITFSEALSDFGVEKKAQRDAAEEQACIEISQATGKPLNKVRGARMVEAVMSGFAGKSDDARVNAEFRPAAPGDRICCLSGTALLKDTSPPAGIEASSATKLQDLVQQPFGRDIWWKGCAFSHRPTSRYPEDPSLEGWSTTKMGRGDEFMGPEILSAVSEILKAEGLAPDVKAQNESHAHRQLVGAAYTRWRHFEELGIAAVRDSDGFLDAAALDQIAQVSALAAAQVFSHGMKDALDVIDRLEELGFNSPDNTYECNDMRDICHVEDEDEIKRFHLRTEHGRYQMDVEETTGKIQVSKNRLVGDFMLMDRDDPSSLSEIWSGRDATDPLHIPYTMRMVRDLNNVILSLSSISCCLEEDHPKRDEDMPSM
ncbi:MAG: hypothetical protein ABJN42_07395 [Roseibium sp.]|uniref:hypothetical protein n=1 Tax=Roseibium sp. TaxID=1936156 RepID=UPI00329A56BD